MKPSCLGVWVTRSTTLWVGVAMLLPSGVRAEQRFSCQELEGVPTTIADTSRGPIPIVYWRSQYFEADGFSPEVRCQTVSQKFQSHFQNGQLNYLTVGRIENTSVICVADQRGGSCRDVLFTLKPGVDPVTVLRQLLFMRTGTVEPLNETMARPYVNMGEVLSLAPTHPQAERPSPPSQLPTELGLPELQHQNSYTESGQLW